MAQALGLGHQLVGEVEDGQVHQLDVGQALHLVHHLVGELGEGLVLWLVAG